MQSRDQWSRRSKPSRRPLHATATTGRGFTVPFFQDPMTVTWQDAIALGAVLAAVVYVLWHVRRTGTRKKPTGCGSCADCPGRSHPCDSRSS